MRGCVCGDAGTIGAPDFVTVFLVELEEIDVQWLCAHGRCLRRVFTIDIEVGRGQ